LCCYVETYIICFCGKGSEDTVIESGELELSQLNGKSVTTVTGNTALEAWGKALIAMGLIDEITLQKALETAKDDFKQVEETAATTDAEEKKDDVDVDDDREGESPEEEELRRKIEAVKEELEEARAEEREATSNLADARLSCVGPSLCNPFHDKDSHYSQQLSWLTTVIRKEKARMGSTGNKKKVITAVNLLDRNNTFFNVDIESLVEGLPGTESLSKYVFQSFRFGYVPPPICDKWHQGAPERERESKKRKAPEKSKSSNKSPADLEKEVKRQKREDERDARKRVKEEELEQKKKARIEERMSRLTLQVEERLFKEACFQREKVVSGMARLFVKECTRRRKAAEFVAMQAVMDDSSMKLSSFASRQKLPDLSPLCKEYDEDVLRCWDFVTSYGNSLIQWGYIRQLPSLDALQAAVDGLRDNNEEFTAKGTMTRSEAVKYLSELCIALCKPLAVSLTRLLFASLIALNPTLQKEFGAAFFAEVRTNASKEEADGPSSSDLLPVNHLTWQEVARLAFLSDAVGELGYAKHEIAHLLRGYRSMGHPNSKEAKRLRRAEDFPLALLRQRMTQTRLAGSDEENSIGTRVRILAPCKPSTDPSNWEFYIHNIKGLNPHDIVLVKDNLKRALEAVADSSATQNVDSSVVSEMQSALSVFEEVVKESEPTSPEIASCTKARTDLLHVLDRVTGGIYSSDIVQNVVYRNPLFESSFVDKGAGVRNNGSHVRLVGLPRDLMLDENVYKTLVHKREEYQADALRLKEDMEKHGEDEDDEDDDDEEEKGNGHKKAMSNSIDDDNAVAAVVENGEEVSSAKKEGPIRIGKVTPYDEFCSDIPTAPELIRRCMAVLRAITQTNAAEPFIYPVDPQTNPGYYDAILQPMCLREIGNRLIVAAHEHDKFNDSAKAALYVEDVVAEFARNMRVITQNCSCYPNAGAIVIAAGDELIRIFERLLLDWVLAPEEALPPLDTLDDDRCVDYNESDEDSLVLLCDSCEAKFNMNLLEPPLKEVPKGDWYCPRCLSGRSWLSLDPRIGKKVILSGLDGEKETWRVERNFFIFSVTESKSNDPPALAYEALNTDGLRTRLSLEQVDQALRDQGQGVSPVRCIQAVSESLGYSQAADRQLYENYVPVPTNPSISEAAAQAFISSSVYRDTLIASSTFMIVAPEELRDIEWSRLLTLLVMKCASSEMMLSLAGELEAEAAEKMSQVDISIKNIQQILPIENDDEEPMEQAEDANEKEAFIVDATSVEVVEDVKVESVDCENIVPPAVSEQDEAPAILPDAVVSEEDEWEKKLTAAREEKEKRYRVREESIVGFCVKNQLRPTFAAFEEDTISPLIDSTLGSKEKGLDLASSRCRAKSCHFCGLSDIALCCPLLRVPSTEEWYDLMQHMSRHRHVFLMADIRGAPGNRAEAPASPSKSKPKKDMVVVKVKVNGELFSYADPDDQLNGSVDGGMTEYLPRNEDGFQLELESRYEAGIPIVTGSLSAHECCAISAHNARKERLIKEHKEHCETMSEVRAGRLCGRTLAIGSDSAGRSYWKFNADEALFVCLQNDSKWRRYGEPEVIASVITSLGKERVAKELKDAFPQAAKLMTRRRWAEILLKRQFSAKGAGSDSSIAAAKQSIKSHDASEGTMLEDEGEPYQPGEQVLVESKCGRMLWDASVIAVSHGKQSEKVTFYRVRYKGWSSRFDEWVTPYRVVDPVENNVLVQLEMVEELRSSKPQVPPALEKMAALKYLNADGRARGKVQLPDFLDIASVPPSASSNEIGLALAKAALLMIEAALPEDAVDTGDTWNSDMAYAWRKTVERASGAFTLMTCVYLLEEAIDPEWMEQKSIHLLSCLPQRWKAIREATVAGLSLRIAMLDQAIQYNAEEPASKASEE
jgi:hypothetical protein